jgi:hypothetical protein
MFYVVNSADPTENTGAKVCAKAGYPYIGFTAKTTDVCKLFHPSAAVMSGMDGSSTGFYCNGAPQGGICAKQTDTCNICPACNLNVDANTDISDQYREMYVECLFGNISLRQTPKKETPGSLLVPTTSPVPTTPPGYVPPTIVTKKETPAISPKVSNVSNVSPPEIKPGFGLDMMGTDILVNTKTSLNISKLLEGVSQITVNSGRINVSPLTNLPKVNEEWEIYVDPRFNYTTLRPKPKIILPLTVNLTPQKPGVQSPTPFEDPRISKKF